MRTRRIYGFGDASVYHCVTRTVNGEMVFGDKEKEMMRRMLRQAVDFSGVELLTYAIMGNHVHVLVRVSRRAREVSDTELVRRFKVLYPKPAPHRVEDIRVVEQMLKDNTEDGQKLRQQLQARMGDVSEFMKTFKQRYSMWFNKSRGRFGPLWCDRFKSTVVEEGGAVLRTVAAYIDLNPVRAGLVEDPKDYRFCGYAEAVAGDSISERGMRAIIGVDSTQAALAGYRMSLYGKGAAPKPDSSGRRISPEAAREVMEQGGELSDSARLLQRIRHFSNGAVIGSALFVDEYIREWSEKLGDIRKRSPEPLDETGLEGVTSFRRERKS